MYVMLNDVNTACFKLLIVHRTFIFLSGLHVPLPCIASNWRLTSGFNRLVIKQSQAMLQNVPFEC